MPGLHRIRVVHSLTSPAHRPSLRRWCEVAAAEHGLPVELVDADTLGAIDALAVEPGVGLLVAADEPEVLARVAELAGTSLIWLGLRVADGPPPAVLADAGVQTVRGRGLDGHRWALRSLIERAAWPLTTHRYGPGRDHVADLRLPAGDGPHPVAILIHGGAWRAQWERDLMDAMGVDLARRGYATWNIEYRRVGEGGGWQETFDDVGAAVDALADVDAPLDLDRVVQVGHSAGGQLGLWAAARRDARVRTAWVVSLAGVPDLVDGAWRGVYERALEGLMGGLPDAVADRYDAGSPAELLPIGVPQLLIHGTADLPDNVDMNRTYAARAAQAGDDVELLELPGVDHFQIIEPRSVPYAVIAQRLEQWLR